MDKQKQQLQLAVIQLDKLLVLFNKYVIGTNFSVYAISSSDFWNYLQIKQLLRHMEDYSKWQPQRT